MERGVIAVDGVVQGVGFRPFVYGLAASLDLRGCVQNQAGGVVIDVEGEGRSLDRFLSELTAVDIGKHSLGVLGEATTARG